MKIVSINKSRTLRHKKKKQQTSENSIDQLSKHYLKSLKQIEELINQHYQVKNNRH